MGVEIDPRTGFIVGGHDGDSERTSVPNIYAIGDILQVSGEAPQSIQNQIGFKKFVVSNLSIGIIVNTIFD